MKDFQIISERTIVHRGKSAFLQNRKVTNSGGMTHFEGIADDTIGMSEARVGSERPTVSGRGRLRDVLNVSKKSLGAAPVFVSVELYASD
jgi:hypothetical protein